eukprot:CAMPEP_0115020220 /NCGR_PEP_ID=MMETSP0216-20121206/29957_1 /TAXON_ID=223996 /ORGANISM="Protocruzia adherens, Strain Boccale" /LENGTH=299 /DNA_ID=CAMNT_0002391935 /DNA_START=216 /DNA_END=1115 /DNA_ORIENTATION=-
MSSTKTPRRIKATSRSSHVLPSIQGLHGAIPSSKARRSRAKKLSSQSAPEESHTGSRPTPQLHTSSSTLSLPKIETPVAKSSSRRRLIINNMQRKKTLRGEQTENNIEDLSQLEDFEGGLDWYIKSIDLKNDRLATCLQLSARAHYDESEHSSAVENTRIRYEKLRALQQAEMPSSLQLADTCIRLSKIYQNCDELSAALQCLKEGCTIQEKVCPYTNQLADTYLSLALLCGQLGEFDDSKKFYIKRCEIQECCSPKSRELIESYRIIADFCRTEGKLALCQDFLEKAQKIEETKYSVQ